MALRHGRCLSLTENRDLDKSRRHQDKFGSSGVQEFGSSEGRSQKTSGPRGYKGSKINNARTGRSALQCKTGVLAR